MSDALSPPPPQGAALGRLPAAAAAAGEAARPEPAKPRPQQAVVRDFFSGGAPYRGLLLYHGLGSGKSCAAVLAAEAAASAAAARGGAARLFIVLKASIRPNFEAEVTKCSRGTLTGGGVEIEYVHMNGVRAAKVSAAKSEIDGKSLHGAVIVIDEVHNLINEAISGGLGSESRGAKLFRAMYGANGAKIIALSATPAVKSPFEIAVLMCLLHGKIWTVRIRDVCADGGTGTGRRTGQGRVRPQPRDQDRTRRCLAEALVKVRANPRVDEAVVVERSDGGPPDILAAVVSSVDHRYAAGAAGAARGRELELAPPQERAWYAPRLSRPPHEALAAELAEAAGSRARPLLESSDLFPLDPETFQVEQVSDTGAGPRSVEGFGRRVAGKVSRFRLSDAESARLGFPTITSDTVHEMPMTPDQFDRYREARAEEARIERALARNRSAAGPAAAEGGRQPGVHRSLSRMACNFAFENRNDRPFQSQLLRRRREQGAAGGDGAGGDGAGAERRGRRFDAVYKATLAAAVRGLRTKDGGAALREPRLSRVHSPKMGAVLAAVTAAGAKLPALVYSQFRNTEGAELMAEVLAANGFARLRFDRTGAVQKSVPQDQPLFLLFGEDEVRHTVPYFNGAPPAAAQQWFEERARRRPGGPPVEVIIITQAGAEGISLKGVRQVFALEPFWNESRILQVVGRASRDGSHSHLPVPERTLAVHRYVAVFAEEQKKDRLVATDKGLTSDQVVARSAERGSAMLRGFLETVEAAAIDCGKYGEVAASRGGKGRPAGAGCMAFPPGRILSELALAQQAAERLLGQGQADYAQTKRGKGADTLKSADTRKLTVSVVEVDSETVALVNKETGERLRGLYLREAYETEGVLVPSGV